VNLGDDDGFHIRIDQILRHVESFAENIEDTIAADKSNQNDIAIETSGVISCFVMVTYQTVIIDFKCLTLSFLGMRLWQESQFI